MVPQYVYPSAALFIIYVFLNLHSFFLPSFSYDSWRPLFYLGSGLSLGAAIFRAILPESEYFLKAKAAGDAGRTGEKSKVFFKQIWAVSYVSFFFACRCLFERWGELGGTIR